MVYWNDSGFKYGLCDKPCNNQVSIPKKLFHIFDYLNYSPTPYSRLPTTVASVTCLRT